MLAESKEGRLTLTGIESVEWIERTNQIANGNKNDLLKWRRDYVRIFRNLYNQ